MAMKQLLLAGPLILSVTTALADAPGPGDWLGPLEYCATPLTPRVLAPQFGPKAPPLRVGDSVGSKRAIAYPGLGTGGSGGHSPHPEVPPQVSLPPSAPLIAAGVAALAWLGLHRKKGGHPEADVKEIAGRLVGYRHGRRFRDFGDATDPASRAAADAWLEREKNHHA